MTGDSRRSNFVLTRRDALRLLVGAGFAASCGAAGVASDRPTTTSPLIRRRIPATGEELPVIGLGTWQTFDAGTSAAARAPLADVLGRFAAAGARVVDSSPMYGRAEQVVGDLSRELALGS